MIGRKLLYILILYIALSFNALYDFYMGFQALILLIALPVVAWAIILIQKLTVRVSLETSMDAALRLAEYDVNIRVKNPTPFPVLCGKLWVRVNNKTKKIVFSAPAFSKNVIKFTGNESHCGQLSIFLDKAVIFDYFKLTNIKIKSSSVARLTILPRLFDVVGQKAGAGELPEESSSYMPDKPGDDLSEIFGVREYQDGDRERNIHWKLSCRLDKLMIKEYSRQEDSQLQFTITLLKGKDENSRNINDLMLESMYSVMHYFLIQRAYMWGVSLTGSQGNYNRHYIDSEEALMSFFVNLLSHNEESENYTALNISMNPKERSVKSIYHFAAAFNEEDMGAIISGGKNAQALVYIPDLYKDRLDGYKEYGIQFFYAALKGGSEICLQDM